MTVLPPATLEGWYSLHQAFTIDHSGLGRLDDAARSTVIDEAVSLFSELAEPAAGWSAGFRLAGGGADVLLVHFRETFDELVEVQAAIRRSAPGAHLALVYDYLAVTEAGLYHATAEAARAHPPGSREYAAALGEAAEAEAASPHVQTRLYPRPPDEMRYLSFYPMSKRRTGADNWYVLEIEERNRLMREHGLTGRRYAGRIFQVICGSVGLDDWEWGVTLFARDPLEFKRIVTEMRYDEASSRFGEFGPFFTGVRFAPGEWRELLKGG